MAKLTDILRGRGRQVENSVNHVVDTYTTFTPVNIGCKRFADSYVMQVLGLIFRGLRNVRYCVDEEFAHSNTKDVEKIADFFNREIQQLVWDAWQYGYIVIEQGESGLYYVPNHTKIHTDKRREVIGYDLVTYTESYRFLGKSDMEVIKDHIDRLDRLVNADDYLTQSLGALGILSGTTLGLTPQDKKDFLDGIKRNIGITREQYQFIVMSNPVDFKQVNLPIADLKLSEKVKDELQVIAGQFGVPYDLIPLSGKSTYDNQEQAVVSFYRNCISPLAEMVLDLGRYTLRVRSQELIPSRALTFTLDNVPELKHDRQDLEAKIERDTKIVDLISKAEMAGIDLQHYKDILENGK